MKRFVFLLSVGWLIAAGVVGQTRPKTVWHVTGGYTQQDAATYFTKNPLDPIEGIWQSTDGYKYAIEKDLDNNGRRVTSKYRMIVYENTSSVRTWVIGDIKAFIGLSAMNSVYTLEYYTADNDRNYSVQSCLGILESPNLFHFHTD